MGYLHEVRLGYMEIGMAPSITSEATAPPLGNSVSSSMAENHSCAHILKLTMFLEDGMEKEDDGTGLEVG
eukprot:scaffold125465_cov49-Attheya_sp.AAC.1